MIHLNRTLRYVGDDCFVNPGENRRAVCMTRYPYYPRGQKLQLLSIALPEILMRDRFLRFQPINAEPTTLQIIVEFHCAVTLLADVLVQAQAIIKSYDMQPIQSVSIRCRETSSWPWHCLMEISDDWSPYIYAPLRCVHNDKAVDIVIFDEHLRRKEKHLVTTVLGLQSMFPDTITRCILKFCVGPWFPRVGAMDAIIMYTALCRSDVRLRQWTTFSHRRVFLGCLSGRHVVDTE